MPAAIFASMSTFGAGAEDLTTVFAPRAVTVAPATAGATGFFLTLGLTVTPPLGARAPPLAAEPAVKEPVSMKERMPPVKPSQKPCQRW